MVDAMRRLLALCLTLAVAGCAWLGGIGSEQVGSPVGSVAYVVDKSRGWGQGVYLPADVPGLVRRLRAELGAEEVARSLEAAGPEVVAVALYFDACAKGGPVLVRSGDRVAPRFTTSDNRNCYRAVDTLTVFAVPLRDLREGTTFALCRYSATWAGGRLAESGERGLC